MPLFKSESILTVNDQLTLENCKIMYKISEDDSPTPLVNLFKRIVNVDTPQTRSQSLSMYPHKSARYNNSFLCKAIMEWLKLSMEVKLLKK